jgi:hypothetical protein
MKKLALILATTLLAARLEAAISVFGQAHDPAAENGATTNSADGVVITPPGSMTTGQFVIVYMMVRANSSITQQIDVTGGQNWHYRARQLGGTNVSAALREWWCIFNGTWAANPGWSELSAADSVQAWMVVFDGVDQTYPIDVQWASGTTTDNTSTTVAATTFNTVTDNAWALIAFASGDDNTWTVDNSVTNLESTAYWRCLQGADNSIVLVRKAIASAGSVGTTTATQATNGADGGVWATLALKPSGTGRKGVML